MNHYIAFLRGINLGKRRIKMDDLRRHFEALKFADVETFIASGNVLFSTKNAAAAELEATVQSHLRNALGYDVDTFLRTRAEVAAIAARSPFGTSAVEDPTATIHVGFLAQPLSPAQRRGLVACRSAYDSFYVEGREYYWLCRTIKTHESKIWSSPELRTLKLPSSSVRNLTTVRKLAALYPVPPA